ncbi:MAG TPA: DNA primase, partial [Candidatus Aenigmarchaeota archaeon]|nr:DNA primase [Candidatus Aenigmarchaeota archaeon]
MSELIERIIESINIVDFISEYVQLKKRGKNYVGLCPFHHEKHPSFTVNPEAQLFYCFGCGKGGNVLNFVTEFYCCSFNEAVQMLSERLGITEKKDPIIEFNIKMAKLFHNTLLKSKRAQQYLDSRNISVEDAKKFNIGLIPKNFSDILRKKDLESVAEKAGISKKLSYVLAGRISFAFIDQLGNVCGFAARTMENKEPKYINTATSLLFKKEKMLFGLNFIKNKTKVYIVEGYFDAITCLKHDIPAVATGGTALTVHQLRQLAHFDKVIAAFDGDKAGFKAALKAFKNAVITNIVVSAVFLPEGEDPDSLIRKQGKESFLNLKEFELSDVFLNIINKLPANKAVKKLNRFKKFLNSVHTEYAKILRKRLEIENITSLRNSREKDNEFEKHLLYILFSDKKILKHAAEKNLLCVLSPNAQQAVKSYLETEKLPQDCPYTPLLAKATISPASKEIVTKTVKLLQIKKTKMALK